MQSGDRLVRSDRRTLALQIDAKGTLIVKAPKRMPLSVINSFVQEKMDWIASKRSLQKQLLSAHPPLEARAGEKLLLLGKDVTLTLANVQKPVLTDDLLMIPVSFTKKALGAFVRSYAKRVLVPLAREQSARLGYQIARIRISSARSRWGSMSQSGTLSLSFYLVLCPREIIDYVLTHELCHRAHMNHSAQFWALVEGFVPDYRMKRDWLKAHGYLMRLVE